MQKKKNKYEYQTKNSYEIIDVSKDIWFTNVEIWDCELNTL